LKKTGDLGDIHQFPLAGLEELPPPVKPDDQEKNRLKKAGGYLDNPPIGGNGKPDEWILVHGMLNV
jgi:hypothetical protein